MDESIAHASPFGENPTCEIARALCFMRLTITSMNHLCDNLSVDIQNCRNEVTSLNDARSYSRLTYLIHRLNKCLYEQISAIKEEKFSRLATTQPARYTRNTNCEYRFTRQQPEHR